MARSEEATILFDALGQRMAEEREPMERMALTAATSAPLAEAPPVDPLAPPAADIVPAPAPVDEPPMERVQVAGLSKVFRRLRRRTEEAETRTQPALRDDPVQFVNDTALIRPLEQAEIDRLSTVFDPQYTKGINLPRLAEGMDRPALGEYLQQLKSANADLFEEARRGTLNFEALLAKADAKNVDTTLYEWLKRGPGEGAAPEDLLAGVLAAVALTRETQGAFLRAFDQTEPALKEAGLRRAAQMLSMEAELYAKISGAGSEAGRSLYVLSQAKKFSGADLDARGDQLIKLFGSEDIRDIEHLGMAYLTLPSPTARAQFVKQGMLAQSMDVMAEVYINALLSNPVSHVLNVVGNATFVATRMMESAVAGVIGKARSSVTGNADRAYVREAYAEWQGIKDGFMDALLVSGKTLITEQPGDIVSKIDLRNRRAIGTAGDPRVIYDEFRQGNFVAGAVNVLGVSARLPGRFLLAEDEFFKGIGYRMGLHKESTIAAGRVYDEAIAAGKTADEATLMQAAEKQRILTNPPQSTITKIQDAAREMTFQKPFQPGTVLAGMQDVVSHPIAKLFVPFFRTPMNIAIAVTERSPLQFVNPTFYKTVAAGGREADVALAKLATGSMIMGTFAYMASGGDDGEVIINGVGPSDPSARQAWLRQGFLPYSISLRQDDGTYTSVTYNRFDPISGILGMAADFAYYAMHESDGQVLDALGAAATTSVANYMMELPMIQGVSEFAAALVIPNRAERAEKIQQILAEKAGAGLLSFFPGSGALSGQIARNQDPVAKNTMLPERGLFGEDPTELPEIMKGFYTALQKYKAQNPYFNPSLPPRLNEWAEPMQAAEGTVWDFLSPVKIKNSQYSPVDEEIQKIGGGFELTKKKISGVDLNAVQYNRLITLANTVDSMDRLPGARGYSPATTMLPILQSVIESTDYQRLPTNEDKQAAITNVVGQFRSAARKLLLQEDPYLAAKVNAQQ
jgi:hypothetical protein